MSGTFPLRGSVRNPSAPTIVVRYGGLSRATYHFHVLSHNFGLTRMRLPRSLDPLVPRLRHGRSARCAALTEPSPVIVASDLLPGHARTGTDERQGLLPVRPQPGKPHPQDAVGWTSLRSGDALRIDGHRMACGRSDESNHPGASSCGVISQPRMSPSVSQEKRQDRRTRARRRHGSEGASLRGVDAICLLLLSICFLQGFSCQDKIL